MARRELCSYRERIVHTCAFHHVNKGKWKCYLFLLISLWLPVILIIRLQIPCGFRACTFFSCFIIALLLVEKYPPSARKRNNEAEPLWTSSGKVHPKYVPRCVRNRHKGSIVMANASEGSIDLASLLRTNEVEALHTTVICAPGKYLVWTRLSNDNLSWIIKYVCNEDYLSSKWFLRFSSHTHWKEQLLALPLSQVHFCIFLWHFVYPKSLAPYQGISEILVKKLLFFLILHYSFINLVSGKSTKSSLRIFFMENI